MIFSATNQTNKNPKAKALRFTKIPKNKQNEKKAKSLMKKANKYSKSVKTIDKQQSDVNVDQFIGYGQINNAAGTNFLYYQKSKGLRQLIHQQLTPSGAIVQGNAIPLNEKQVEWMPRSLKQVGEKEAILPYQTKGKLGFAKITIQ